MTEVWDNFMLEKLPIQSIYLKTISTWDCDIQNQSLFGIKLDSTCTDTVSFLEIYDSKLLSINHFWDRHIINQTNHHRLLYQLGDLDSPIHLLVDSISASSTSKYSSTIT